MTNKFPTTEQGGAEAQSRRAFLRGTLAGGLAVAGAGAAAAAENRPVVPAGNPKNLPPNVAEWSQVLGDGVTDHPYGKPIKFESHVVRRTVEWLTADRQSSINFTPLHALDGIITPNGLCFERHHGGAAEINPTDYRLMLHGLVDKPLFFTLEDLQRFPRTNKVFFLECAANSGMEWRGAQLNSCQYTHGMVHNVMYTGTLLKNLLDEAGLKPKAKWLLVEGGDAAGMNRSIPIEKALEDTLVVWKMNGEALRKEQGYPVRLVVPGWEGNMWIKWLRRIEVGDMPWLAREETSKYTDLMADGRSRRFTFIMDAKSIVTNPSPESPFGVKGRNVISGLAWSGRGPITRVDVTLDGGRNWREARLDGPVLDKSLTRFYVDFDWNGSELMIQSRAHDATGYVQPTKAELRAIRGVNSIYHNNGIHTWLVRANGEAENVEIG
ncbi:MAG: sulfite dehydrogenase [Hyphomicrobiaceae bacterium]|nr:sulfite dehydrogenase [Hyphomicrobiaceae bacterium]